MERRKETIGAEHRLGAIIRGLCGPILSETGTVVNVHKQMYCLYRRHVSSTYTALQPFGRTRSSDKRGHYVLIFLFFFSYDREAEILFF